ncbi:nuclear transport factor 2 family protein [Nocardioides sp. R1-1]|uniref:nuclear transport factor 2 family protein n=1 Tax=Nocardioides sp. R1-1 TaxID=3383502 RepID=UPI0038D1C204
MNPPESAAPSVSLTAVERLEAFEEIKRVFARRLRALDHREWDVYPLLHTEDVVSETWGDLPEEAQPRTDGVSNRVVGRAALQTTIREFIDGPVRMTTVHHGHNPEITLTSDATATGVWAMEDELWWTHGEREERLKGYGHYYEEYAKVAGEWLISYRSLTRLREETTTGFYDFLLRTGDGPVGEGRPRARETGPSGL